MQPGAIAGLVATVPMTLFMLAMQRLLPPGQKYALPPEELTREFAQRTDTDQNLSKPQLLGTSIAAHFGYGASTGLIYANVTKRLKWPPLLKGSLFGILIWAASYLGWMPLGRFDAAATNEPPKRNLMMIAAHVIWGAVTGLVNDQLEKR